MLKKEKFYFDIENIKKDLAIEDMQVTQENIEILEKYANHEISMEEIIENIERNVLEGE